MDFISQSFNRVSTLHYKRAIENRKKKKAIKIFKRFYFNIAVHMPTICMAIINRLK